MGEKGREAFVGQGGGWSKRIGGADKGPGRYATKDKLGSSENDGSVARSFCRFGVEKPFFALLVMPRWVRTQGMAKELSGHRGFKRRLHD